MSFSNIIEALAGLDPVRHSDVYRQMEAWISSNYPETESPDLRERLRRELWHCAAYHYLTTVNPQKDDTVLTERYTVCKWITYNVETFLLKCRQEHFSLKYEDAQTCLENLLAYINKTRG